MARRNWNRDELILAFNLYCKLPFGRMHSRNPQVIKLAKLIGRSAGAVAWKLVNFARLDPSLQERGVQGATHGSKKDVEIWDEFSNDWERLAFESEKLVAKYQSTSIESATGIEVSDLPDGKERLVVVKARVNQGFFRRAVLAAYNSRCCITGLPITSLLVASHIIPWSQARQHRTDPRNGLCLNAIHDKAFDRGLLTITPDFEIKVSAEIHQLESEPSVKHMLLHYNSHMITLPKKFRPNPVFLQYHNEQIFLG